MAKGTQFLTLVTRLRAELRKSTSVAVGVDDLDSLKATINHSYSTLYQQSDWPHLRKVFSVALLAGERYYDLPTGLNTERIERAAIYWSGLPQTLQQGIGFDEMAAFDSDADERNEPALRWDVRWTGTSTQIEVWPIPSSDEQTLRFEGTQAIARLVEDTDLCALDDDLVVLFAAAELAAGAGAKDADFKAQMAREHLQKLKGRAGTQQEYRLGLGASEDRAPSRFTVVVR